jgi:hypothetical protein
MAYNLYQLSILFDKKEWRQRAFDVVSSLGKVIILYPTSFRQLGLPAPGNDCGNL